MYPLEHNANLIYAILLHLQQILLRDWNVWKRLLSAQNLRKKKPADFKLPRTILWRAIIIYRHWQCQWNKHTMHLNCGVPEQVSRQFEPIPRQRDIWKQQWGNAGHLNNAQFGLLYTRKCWQLSEIHRIVSATLKSLQLNNSFVPLTSKGQATNLCLAS